MTDSTSPSAPPQTTEDALAKVIREEIVRQHRENERGTYPAGAYFYEEHVSPYLIARRVMEALSV